MDKLKIRNRLNKQGADALGAGLKLKERQIANISKFPDGTYVIVGHGNNNGIQLDTHFTALVGTTNMEHIVPFLEANAYDGNKTIFLNVCFGYESGLAQAISNHYGVSVIAISQNIVDLTYHYPTPRIAGAYFVEVVPTNTKSGE